MRFTISSSKLFSQLQAVSRVINSKNALPILDDVLFDLAGNELKLTASDGETTIRTSLEVENVEGAGKVASAAKLLMSKKIPFITGRSSSSAVQKMVFSIELCSTAAGMTIVCASASAPGISGYSLPFTPTNE